MYVSKILLPMNCLSLKYNSLTGICICIDLAPLSPTFLKSILSLIILTFDLKYMHFSFNLIRVEDWVERFEHFGDGGAWTQSYEWQHNEFSVVCSSWMTELNRGWINTADLFFVFLNDLDFKFKRSYLILWLFP